MRGNLSWFLCVQCDWGEGEEWGQPGGTAGEGPRRALSTGHDLRGVAAARGNAAAGRVLTHLRLNGCQQILICICTNTVKATVASPHQVALLQTLHGSAEPQ